MSLSINKSPSGVRSFEWTKGNILKSQTDAWIEELINETDKIKASEKFQQWLDVQAKFPRFSYRNAILILQQCPYASLLGGAKNFWIPKMHRFIKKDEWKNPIRILAPCFKKRKRKDGDDEESLVYFRTVNVYDVSQTEGKPIPSVEMYDVKGNSLSAWFEALKEFCKTKGITLSFKDRGDCSYGLSEVNKIELNPSKSVNTQVTTLLHEIGHELLHDKVSRRKLPEEIKELQAESFAYIIGKAFGLDFPAPAYFAIRGFNVKRYAKCMKAIANRTREVIQFIDHSLKK